MVSSLATTSGDGDEQGYLKKGYLWFLVFGNREVLTLLLLLLIFAVTMAVGSVPGVANQMLYTENLPGTALLYLLTGTITLVTVVLSINQLVLSHQLGSVEEQETAIRSLLSHRAAVSEHTDSALTPEQPTAFLSLLLSAILGLVQDTSALLGDASIPEDHREQLQAFLDTVKNDFREAEDGLSDTTFQDVLLISVLEKVNATSHLRRIRDHQRTAEALPMNEENALDDLEKSLELFVISAEYFKIAYLQTQFIRFSRSLLLISIPALIITFFTSTLIAPGLTAGTTAGADNLLWITAAALAIAVSPFALLISYMARLMTLSRTTVFSGPFTREDTVEPLLQ